MMLSIKKTVYIFLSGLLLGVSPCAKGQKKFVKQVDPFIGVHGGGNMHPAATLPYSVVSLGPDVESIQSPSGYGYTPGKRLIGFSHARTSGTGGGGRYGNFLVLPQSGEPRLNERSSAADREIASPGYYGCNLRSGNIDVDLTLSDHVGFHQYTFHEGTVQSILINVSSTRLTKEKSVCTEAYVHILSGHSLEGFAKYQGGWGGKNPYTAYFYAEFDQDGIENGTWNNDGLSKIQTGQKAGDDVTLGAFFKFAGIAGKNKTVKFKLAISYQSIDKAKQYFTGSPGWDFDKFKLTAENRWEQFLSRIRVKGGTEDQRKLFYTAFYRTAMIPRDLSGDNPLWKSNEPHYWDFYTFWDTFRTVNPLLTIIDQKRESGIIRCLLDIYQHRGWLPDAWTGGDYGSIQGGSNADVVITEAMLKNIKGFDYQLAFKAMINDAQKQAPDPTVVGRFVNVFDRYGYLPSATTDKLNDPTCGTSRTLEYSYNDFCIALAAKKLGKLTDYRKFLTRSTAVFDNLYCDSLQVFWAKDSSGKWLPGYSKETNGRSINGVWSGWFGPYYEGSPLSYSCAALQDIGRIIKLHGGSKKFESFLNDIFDSNSYESDNEPAMHIPYMYIYAGDTHKTYERLREILKSKYKTTKTGWPGNDDAGTTSAWYMWGAMGIYPVAGQTLYLLTTPTFQTSDFTLESGNHFVIDTKNLSDTNSYIQSATWNGKPWKQAWIRHSDLMKGGKLVLIMGSKASGWGSKNLPPSFDRTL